MIIGGKMSIIHLTNRRKIESLYDGLEIIRRKMRSLMLDNIENLTLENLIQLEKQEEKILHRIMKLKSLLHMQNRYTDSYECDSRQY
jgi:hypothetical protein